MLVIIIQILASYLLYIFLFLRQDQTKDGNGFINLFASILFSSITKLLTHLDQISTSIEISLESFYLKILNFHLDIILFEM